MEKIEINQNNNINNFIENNESTENRLGLLEIEEMLKNNIEPPGIMEYDDMPPETPLEPSQSLKPKAKKVKSFLKIKQIIFKVLFLIWKIIFIFIFRKINFYKPWEIDNNEILKSNAEEIFGSIEEENKD